MTCINNTTCNGELKDRFSIIIARNLDEIRNNFIIGLRKIGYSFDEDMFVDVGIRCALTLNGKPITKKELIKYFWTAYINTFKNNVSKLQSRQFDDKISDKIIYNTTSYNIDIDILYKIITYSIKNEFGEDVANAWIDHFCYDKTYKELKDTYGDRNYIWIFRKIKKYILTKLPKINPKYNEIVNNLFD